MDGKHHINLSFTGNTEIGRELSTLTDKDICTDDGWFKSLEGYIYYLQFHDEKFRTLSEWAVKSYGKKCGKIKKINKKDRDKIEIALAHSMVYSPLKEDIIKSELPFRLYYDFGGRLFTPRQYQFIPEFAEKVRVYMRENL